MASNKFKVEIDSNMGMLDCKVTEVNKEGTVTYDVEILLPDWYSEGKNIYLPMTMKFEGDYLVFDTFIDNIPSRIEELEELLSDAILNKDN